MHHHLNLYDATFVHLHNFEGEMMEVDAFAQLREVSLELEKESCQ